jgi:hypothetical protein
MRIATLFAIAVVAFATTAQAAGPRLNLPIDPLHLNTSGTGTSGTGSAGKGGGAPTACDFNLFANLTAENVLSQINQCVQSKVEGAASLFLPDVTAALASATSFGDQPGVACLKPALAIVQAAAGSPAVPASPEIPATATTPAVPAVAAVAAQIPGPVLIFQKFREFELSGGPAACKTWVNSTIAGANPLTN